MTSTEPCAVAVFLTKAQLRKMIDDRLISKDEVPDRAKLARVVSRLLDSALGLPETSWHNRDDWAKGLE
jgi:hypothetical protein